MSNQYFRFKQFAVYHDKCAMKVGTDGVLLGAWADIDSSRCVLDVGTGSGLIALMVSQRNVYAKVVAIDIDVGAILQTMENVKRSPFNSRISAHQISLQDFADSSPQRFDHIICNPPFFEKSLKSPDKQRTAARHSELLTIGDLFAAAKKLMSDDGRISIILPCERLACAKDQGELQSLYITRETWVKPLPDKNPKRVLLEFSNVKSRKVIDSVVIESSPLNYSPEYTELTKDFYLNM